MQGSWKSLPALRPEGSLASDPGKLPCISNDAASASCTNLSSSASASEMLGEGNLAVFAASLKHWPHWQPLWLQNLRLFGGLISSKGLWEMSDICDDVAVVNAFCGCSSSPKPSAASLARRSAALAARSRGGKLLQFAGSFPCPSFWDDMIPLRRSRFSAAAKAKARTCTVLLGLCCDVSIRWPPTVGKPCSSSTCPAASNRSHSFCSSSINW